MGKKVAEQECIKCHKTLVAITVDIFLGGSGYLNCTDNRPHAFAETCAEGQSTKPAS